MPEARSTKQRLAADAPPESVAKLAHSNTAFALELLHGVHPDGNFFYSPHSLSIALAMTYAGAAGSTKLEMNKVLHFDQTDAELHAAFNSVDQALAARGKNAQGTDGQPFRLRVSNALWAQKDVQLLPTFLDVLAENYGVGVKLVDFAGDTAGAGDLINAWVSAVTEKKVPTLLQPGDVDPLTVLVLTNTVYFNASWAHSFRQSDTSSGSFTRLDGSSVTVPLMQGQVGQARAQGSGWQAGEIDYAGGEVSMLVIVPDAGKFADFEKTFDVTKLEEIVGALVPESQVHFVLPKLQVRTHLNLEATLAAMGMPTPFDADHADFSGMNGAKDLYIRHVVHEAFVNVNEAGTEAAAASAVVVNTKSASAIDATRPFFFVIRDKQTGVAVFIGRVVDPSAT